MASTVWALEMETEVAIWINDLDFNLTFYKLSNNNNNDDDEEEEEWDICLHFLCPQILHNVFMNIRVY